MPYLAQAVSLSPCRVVGPLPVVALVQDFPYLGGNLGGTRCP